MKIRFLINGVYISAILMVKRIVKSTLRPLFELSIAIYKAVEYVYIISSVRALAPKWQFECLNEVVIQFSP